MASVVDSTRPTTLAEPPEPFERAWPATEGTRRAGTLSAGLAAVRNWLGPVMIFVGFAWFATFLTDANGLIVEPDLPSAPSAPSPAQPGSAMPG